ncbi:hypothetical protein [Leifsonia sp. AG29]|uniref:hypothetical protein n=1 Tax=Leifsonia sp. AG29 TaxID=2598860 RepID=UPI00131B5DE7|nr:hypothetical protein [Leifsonia sp. AG29]
MSGLGVTVPGWALRALFVAIALALALIGTPNGPWQAIAAVLAGISVAVPRWLTAWVLIGALAFSCLLEPGGPSVRLLALIAGVHAMHVLASWALVTPLVARLQPAALLPSLRRYLGVQVVVQPGTVALLLLARGSQSLAAIASGAAVVALVAVLAPVLLRRRPD